jgi:hypothetical protein
LNPHGIAPASTSSYSSHSKRHGFEDLTFRPESDRLPTEASVGTNASHDEAVLWKRDAVAEGGARADTALTRSGSVRCRCKTAHTPSIQLRRAGCQPSFRVGLFGRGMSVRIKIEICPVFGTGAQTPCARKTTFFPRLCNAVSSQRFCKSRCRAADYKTFWVPQIVDNTGNDLRPRAPVDSVPAEVEQVSEQVDALARAVPPGLGFCSRQRGTSMAAWCSDRGVSARFLWLRRGAS